MEVYRQQFSLNSFRGWLIWWLFKDSNNPLILHTANLQQIPHSLLPPVRLSKAHTHKHTHTAQSGAKEIFFYRIISRSCARVCGVWVVSAGTAETAHSEVTTVSLCPSAAATRCHTRQVLTPGSAASPSTKIPIALNNQHCYVNAVKGKTVELTGACSVS